MFRLGEKIVSSVPLEFNMIFFLPLLIKPVGWRLSWYYNKWCSGLTSDRWWLNTGDGSSEMNAQHCVSREERADQGAAQQTLTARWLWKAKRAQITLIRGLHHKMLLCLELVTNSSPFNPITKALGLELHLSQCWDLLCTCGSTWTKLILWRKQLNL